MVMLDTARFYSARATVDAAGITVDVNGAASLLLDVAISAGTFTLTLTGAGYTRTFYAIRAEKVDTGAVASTISAAGLYRINTVGLTAVNIALTAIAGGGNVSVWGAWHSVLSNGQTGVVNEILPGSGALDLGKLEDSVANSGDLGVMMLAMRHNAQTPTTDADGDYETLHVDQSGYLKAAIMAGAAGVPFDRQVPSADGQTLGSSSGLQVSNVPHLLTGTSTFDRQRGAIIVKEIAAVAITAATPATIWTPAAGKKVRLMGWALSVSVAASLIFKYAAGGTTLHRTELLAAAGISYSPASYSVLGQMPGAANDVLKLDVTASGTVSGYVFGCEE